MGSEKMEPKGGEPELQRGEPEHLEPNERFEFLPHDEVIASFGYTRWIYGDLWAAFDQYRSRVYELESRASRAEARVVEIEAERAETEAKLAAVERRNGELESAMLRIRKEAATIDDALTIIDPFDLSATARRNLKH